MMIRSFPRRAARAPLLLSLIGSLVAVVPSAAQLAAEPSADARADRILSRLLKVEAQEASVCREAPGLADSLVEALGDSNCCTANGGLGCDDSTCSDLICFDVAPECCTPVGSGGTGWDQFCADIANSICGVCGGSLCPGTSECCQGGNPTRPPKCEDPECCGIVCGLDPYCCGGEWDSICIGLAEDVCQHCANSSLGDCCTAHGGVSCSTDTCALAVCSVDPYCCGFDGGTWDEACVAAAIEECSPSACPRTLTVTRTGAGTGTLDGTGISCPGDCTETYGYGTAVSLSANPTGGSVFTGWSQDCTGTGTCELTMDANHAVTGNINPGNQTLTVAVAGLGSGSVTDDATAGTAIDCPGDCTESYAYGTIVALTATPSGSAVFGGWSGACTGTGACQVTMTAARSVTATFNPPNQTLTATKSGTGTGSITGTGINCPGDCTQDYPYGTIVDLTANPSAPSTFAGWSGDCSGDTTCQVTMDQARSVTGTFDPPPPQDLTVTVDGLGSGSVTGTGIACPEDCTESYAYGTVVSLTATPDGSDVFAGWSGACTGTTTCNVTMTAARSVTATFNPPNQTLTVAASGSGTGTITATGISCPGDCTQDFAYGTIVSLTATPTGGSSFVEWTGDCTGSTTCQVTMDQARSVTATFDPAPPQSLTVVVTGAGSGSVTDDGTAGTDIDCPGDCSESYPYGTVVDLTAAPDPGSLFDGWSDDCAASGTDPGCQLTMTAGRTATATFVIDPDVFSDDFESADLCAWSSQSGGPACGP